MAGLLLSMSSPLEYLDGSSLCSAFAFFFLIYLYRFFHFVFSTFFHFQHRASYRQRFGYWQFRFERYHTSSCVDGIVFTVFQFSRLQMLLLVNIHIDCLVSGSSDAKFAFCVDKDTTPVTIFGANIVFYCFWTLITIIVSHPYIWGVLRIVPYKILAKVSKPEDRITKTFSDNPFPERIYPFPLSHIPSIVECRGRLTLDFAITVRVLFAY